MSSIQSHSDTDTPRASSSPPQDLSARVVDLARVIDRLPPGVYEITLRKEDVRALAWQVDITRMEKIQSLKLDKHSPME